MLTQVQYMLHKLDKLAWFIVKKLTKGGVTVNQLDNVDCDVVPKNWVVVVEKNYWQKLLVILLMHVLDKFRCYLVVFTFHLFSFKDFVRVFLHQISSWRGFF